MPCQFAGTLESSEVEASAGHGYDSGLRPRAGCRGGSGYSCTPSNASRPSPTSGPSPRSSIPGGSVWPGAPSGVLQHALSVNGRVAGRRSAARLGTPGDMPKRPGDAAPPWPVAPVSTVAPASTAAPASTVAMAPIARIAPMALILLPQNPSNGGWWCRARDARTQANGTEPQCADHRSSGRNLLQIHCQTPFANPYEIATLGGLNSCPRSAIWCNPRRNGESRTTPTDTVSARAIACRSSSLPWTRRQPHHLTCRACNRRRTGHHSAPIPMPRRAGYGADLHRT